MIEEYGLCRLDPNCDVGYYAGTSCFYIKFEGGYINSKFIRYKVAGYWVLWD